MTHAHTEKIIEAEIRIEAAPAVVWDHITNVQLEQFADPLLFRLLDVPKPLRAELLTDGAGGSRTAYFANGKKFEQKILIWEPYTRYSFRFNPEPGFRVGYVFELSAGIFRMLAGSYYLRQDEAGGTWLRLETQYSVQRRLRYVLLPPITLVLRVFQRYLLTSIKRNAEQ
ncbi:hypothetical protein E5K00_03350 [Hymenobacter aquaticus]|uniref:SRPBCC family protein n=1 Tax=Hymenobacter aquaticus TaxID=1867101 RepID=A0A4Z0Q540_9BACT|nr:hypothetical protein [Hymenobacter aquaticus]TGE24263.1 hypothetical protein E5K00_03350 [Hymenobacter aquaticus]